MANKRISFLPKHMVILQECTSFLAYFIYSRKLSSPIAEKAIQYDHPQRNLINHSKAIQSRKMLFSGSVRLPKESMLTYLLENVIPRRTSGTYTFGYSEMNLILKRVHEERITRERSESSQRNSSVQLQVV